MVLMTRLKDLILLNLNKVYAPIKDKQNMLSLMNLVVPKTLSL